jgi:hypothetical protein
MTNRLLLRAMNLSGLRRPPAPPALADERADERGRCWALIAALLVSPRGTIFDTDRPDW